MNLEKKEPRWMPYKEYIANKYWMEGITNLYFKYGGHKPPPEEVEELKIRLEKLMKDYDEKK